MDCSSLLPPGPTVTQRTHTETYIIYKLFGDGSGFLLTSSFTQLQPIFGPLSAAKCSVASVTSTSCLHLVPLHGDSPRQAGVFSSCCLALDSSSSFPCPAFLAIAKSVSFICGLTHTELPKLLHHWTPFHSLCDGILDSQLAMGFI
ncbi:hypothetical protein STEG23_022456 [Scotinomys teguina]